MDEVFNAINENKPIIPEQLRPKLPSLHMLAGDFVKAEKSIEVGK